MNVLVLTYLAYNANIRSWSNLLPYYKHAIEVIHFPNGSKIHWQHVLWRSWIKTTLQSIIVHHYWRSLKNCTKFKFLWSLLQFQPIDFQSFPTFLTKYQSGIVRQTEKCSRMIWTEKSWQRCLTSNQILWARFVKLQSSCFRLAKTLPFVFEHN